MPSYNVMGVAKAALEASVRYLAADLGPQGIRVNALSAGPMRTLSGAGVSDARVIFNYQKEHAPLKRTPTLDEVGGSALYLLSDLSGAVTGEVHFVDCGYNTVAMPSLDALKAASSSETRRPHAGGRVAVAKPPSSKPSHLARADDGAAITTRMIGVFDSGLGGLTVLRALVAASPTCPFSTSATTPTCPTATARPTRSSMLTRTGVEALFRRGCKLVLLGCNTATASPRARCSRTGCR